MRKIINLLSINERWLRPLLALFLSVVTVIFIYRETALHMLRQWSASDTYAHGFLVPFISVWLIWRVRNIWMNLNPQPALATVFLFLLFSLFWFFGNLVAVNAVTQFSLVMMIALCIPAVLGWNIASVILFPIAFLFFAVPIGDFMLPSMMDWTADFTVVALQLTGIPVYRENLQFVIPSGRWSVVEACSGIRYLLASLTVGSLFAYLNYKSFKKRLVFIGFSIAVPLVANWLRAYLIVLIGHYSGNKLATGVDHLIYGWVFFGIIIVTMLYVGMKWTDYEPDKIVTNNIGKEKIFLPNDKYIKAYFLIFAIAAFPHILNQFIISNIHTLSVNFENAIFANNWKSENDIRNDWQPLFPNSVAQFDKNFENLNGEKVGLHISYYRQQNYERKLVSSTNDLLANNNENWMKTGRNSFNANDGSGLLAVESTTLKRKTVVDDKKYHNIQAWKFYWVDDKFTSNDIYAKILGALSKIKGKGDDGAIIVIYTAFSDAQAYKKETEFANLILEKFFKENYENIKSTLLNAKNN